MVPTSGAGTSLRGPIFFHITSTQPRQICSFSLADSAFAFACNNRNNLSVALDVTITFTKAVNVGDVLTAEAKEIHNGRSTGVYLITVTNQKNESVALFKGTCFRTGKTLIQQ